MLSPNSRNIDFPSLADQTYLNTAAEGIPPQEVLRALEQYGQDKLLGMDGRILHAEHRHSLCQRAAKFLGLTTAEIGICSCASEAFQLAAVALQLKEGDEVIINDLDFPAGATPWLQPGCNANVKVWRSRNGILELEDLAALLSPRTQVVSTSLVSFFNGFKMDLERLAEVTRDKSEALIAVDVTQALGRIPLELECADLIISATHKWILGSHGGGLVGVPSRVADRWTTGAGGWFHLENAFENDRFDRVVTQAGAPSFSTGMPNYPAIYAVNAALGYIDQIGVEAIDAHCQPLMSACLEGLQELDVQLLSPTDASSLAGILAFVHPRADEIYQHLHQHQIHIMSHAGRLRIAIHGYNTESDIAQLLRELKAALGRFS
jgi:cysteine desulfurase/selenocysteine lyase